MNDSPDNTAEIDKPAEAWLAPEQVKDYLLANPDFFQHHPMLAEQLVIPHQKRGSVSLVELQAEQLREKVSELQNRLTKLMSVARQNEAIYRIYADLHLKLFHCSHLDEVKTALVETVSEGLQLSEVVLHLYESEQGVINIELQRLLDKRLKHVDFFFGRLNQDENKALFAGKEPKSVVLMRLKHQKDIGLLAIGSEDDGHFYPEMDTLLITQLQQFLSLLIPKVQA